ncbi:hypothetical protein OH799_07600 [Nocardia sp. NBC_00881]|uniref:hypothetical protein n=1 Tax=Nocardia sp. NBC_00881 TaxID=2975995 RepID=UPI00386D3C6A|nr:hypothetical protein OH799_07600 [Nocardia sp. NBC_00881]
MTENTLAPVIPLLVPGTTGRFPAGQSGSGLPLPRIRERHAQTGFYSIRPIDTNGRVMDRALLDVLAWKPGDRLRWRVHEDLIIISRTGYGTVGVTKHGHLRLPAESRHAVGLVIGARVLLAADPTHGILVVYPPEVLAEMAACRFAGADDGDLP